MTLDENQRKAVFQFFNEIAIIQQLSSAMFNKCLPDGIHVSHFAVLNHMVRLGDGKTPLTLADTLQVTKGTMTHTLSALLQRGFIRMKPHATDGRSKLVFLTKKGREFQIKAVDSLGPAMSALDGKLDYKQMIKMLPELAKVRSVLDENRHL